MRYIFLATTRVNKSYSPLKCVRETPCSLSEKAILLEAYTKEQEQFLAEAKDLKIKELNTVYDSHLPSFESSALGANAIYLNAVRAKRLIIECLDERGNLLESFEREFFEDKVSSWSEYFFGDWVEKIKAHDVFYECKILSRSCIFRVRASGLDRVEIGSIIAGSIKELATTLYAKNSISMIDFSKVSTDEEGNTALVKGNFKRTNAFELLVDENELDFVMSELANLRGEACVFIIADNFECLMNFAFLKNHELLLSKRGKSIISVEIEGLV